MLSLNIILDYLRGTILKKDKIQSEYDIKDIGLIPNPDDPTAGKKKKVEIENAYPLTTPQVKARIAQGLVNGEQTIRTKSVGQILKGNIFTFFNFVFLILAVLLIIFERNNFHIGDFGFLILVIINTLIGIIQELKAKHTMDKLSLISAPKVTVIRDNTEKEIAVAEIVMDDIVILSTGAQICADAVVIDGCIEVNESAVTGEPDAITKNPGDEVISGSYIVSGRAQAKVIHVGPDNFAMKISMGAKYVKKPNSEIWKSLMLIIKIMSIIIIPLGISLFCVKQFIQNTGANVDTTVISVIGTLVGLIPSGLVALTSAVFAISVIRLSRHNTLAQDMYCVETLARVDVLCLDKTGTITEGSMEVKEIQTEKGVDEKEFRVALRNLLNATQDDNPTANAVRAYVSDEESTGTATDVIAFSSIRKWSGATINKITYALGAPEFLFKKQTKAMSTTILEQAKKGYRVLALVRSKEGFKKDELPKSLDLMGYVFITDKIRDEAPDTLRFFKEEGVTIKVISGDNPVTVQAVARRAGLEDCNNIVDMSTIETDQDLLEAAEKYSIFGRVLPDQKLKLVKALKSHGHTVAMTGDGVNDVLALKEADCSIAMASGSDAAKNVSSLVLLDSNFASMPKVVAEGRRSINNLTRTASLYILKTIYNLLIAVIFMIVPLTLPFEPSNLTLVGMLTIGIPSVILALEPNTERVKGRFLPKVLCQSLPGSLAVIFGVIGIIVYYLQFNTTLNYDAIKDMFIITLTAVGFVYLIKVCFPFKKKEGIINAIMITILVAVFAIIYWVDVPVHIESLYDLFAKMGINPDSVLKSFFKIGTISWDIGKPILIMFAIIVPAFAGMVFLFELLLKKIEKKLDEYHEMKALLQAEREKKKEEKEIAKI